MLRWIVLACVFLAVPAAAEPADEVLGIAAGMGIEPTPFLPQESTRPYLPVNVMGVDPSPFIPDV